MKVMRKIVAVCICITMLMGFIVPSMAVANSQEDMYGKSEKVDDTWYYHSLNDKDLMFEKISNPESGPRGIDGLLDVDEVNDSQESRSQSYAWSAADYGDYIYIGTCYNSTYGIYYRNLLNTMVQSYAEKVASGEMTQEEANDKAAKIARDFIRFAFDGNLPEKLNVNGLLVKLHKETGEFSLVYDSKKSDDPAIVNTFNSGFRMGVEFKGSLYFVSLANPTMFC